MKRCFGSPDREWLHPENFADEPIYCEAPQNPNDILYHGSDDEAYNSSTERRIRCENQAQRFLEGKPLFLLSASLRGPFDKKSGWVNPWRSKSASRPKRTQKKRRPVLARAAEQIESSGILDSGSVHQRTPESTSTLRQNIYGRPRYMDGETFNRVWNWRDEVLAESDTLPSSVHPSSPAEPASADSRRATQQTERGQSDLTLDTVDAGRKSSTSCASSGVSNVEGQDELGISGRKDGLGLSLPPKPVPVAEPSQATISQKSHSSGALQNAIDVSPLDTTELSPCALGTYEQSTRNGHVSAVNQIAAGTITLKTVPTEVSPLLKAPAVKEYPGERNTTPGGALVEAAASSALRKTQASARTGGSFRYWRKDAREEGSSLRRSKSADPPSASNDTAERAGPGDGVSREQARQQDETPEPSDVGNTQDVPTAIMAGAILVSVDVAAGIQGQGTPDDAPQLETSQSNQQPREQTTDQFRSEDGDSAETSSQIDGPTLVPSASPSGSEYLSMPSFGHFSCERYSQDMVSEATQLPRKLLWPKPLRSASSGDSQPVFGLESTRSLVSTQSELMTQRCHSDLPSQPTSSDEHVSRTAEEINAVQEPAEKVPTPVQSEQPPAGEVVEEETNPIAEVAAASETESEAEDEDTHGTEQPQVEAPADTDAEVHAEPGLQTAPSCPTPEAQSPWAKDGAVLSLSKSPCPRSPQHNGAIEIPETRSNPPKATQSPWTGEANVLPGTSTIPAQLPSPQPATAELSFLASKTLDQAVSQSPWARGDSQMQVPDARLFNPLSSPANSHVLPAADPVSRSPVPRDEDTNMCDSQLYAPHPSTPETKHSSLPTPDFTLSVKSFKNFMTPSPQPAAKRRRISAAAADDFPSTQALVEAAISNPWTRPSITKPKKQKRKQQVPSKHVSWAPLPDEDLESSIHPDMVTSYSSSSPFGTELPTATHHHRQPMMPRATSPPPSILATSKLPAENQKFGKHFAAAASRRVGTTPLLHNRQKQNRNVVRLLPSDSQQVCGSPVVEAMAEAFLRVDAATSEAVCVRDQGVMLDESMAGLEVEVGTDTGPGMGMDVDGWEKEGEGSDMELVEEEEEGNEGEGTQEMPDLVEEEAIQVDEVSAVMENLDDFLGGNWDLDAELAQQARESRGCGSFGGANAAGLSGLMDVGVWD